jgi:hypothetical protein
MKNLIYTLLLLLFSYVTFAQKESCGEELYKKHLTENPELKLLHDNLKYQYLISMDKGELGGGRPEEIEIRIPV